MRWLAWVVCLTVGPGWAAVAEADEAPLAEAASWLAETAAKGGLKQLGVSEFEAVAESAGGSAGAAGRYLAERLAELAAAEDPARQWLGPARLTAALGDALTWDEVRGAERLASALPGLDGLVSGQLSVTAETCRLGLSLRSLGGTLAAERTVILPMTPDLLVLLGVNAAVGERRGLRPRLEELADLALVAPAEQVAPQFAADCPFTLELLFGGRPRALVSRAGALFVPVTEREIFQIRLGNHSRERVGVALFVDGLNSIGQRGESPSRAVKWLLDPGQSTVVPGWQMSDRQAREFVVVGLGDSVAAHRRLTDKLGLITAAFYAEAPAVGAPPGEERREIPLGTGEGANREAAVRRVTFCAAEVPAAILSLRYERAATADAAPR